MILPIKIDSCLVCNRARAPDLSGMASGPMQAFIQSLRAASEKAVSPSGKHFGTADETLGASDGKTRICGQKRHAVSESQRVAAFETQRMKSGIRQSLRCRHPHATAIHLAFACQNTSEKGERHQISARANRSNHGNHRENAKGKQIQTSFDQLRTNSGIALGERLRAQQDRGADHRFRGIRAAARSEVG